MTSPIVYGCCGFRNSSRTLAVSTILPAYITATRSHILATMPKSWLTKIIATFVSRSIVKEGTSTDRLAEAFHALVPDHERRHHLVGLAHDETAASPLGQKEGFESLWTSVSSMLSSYSDASFVSDAYGRELSGARTQAIEVERVSDDPPERMAAWVGADEGYRAAP